MSAGHETPADIQAVEGLILLQWYALRWLKTHSTGRNGKERSCPTNENTVKISVFINDKKLSDIAFVKSASDF